MQVQSRNSPSSSRRGRSRRQPMAEINVTPFVDVMLVLLIIFMVAAPLLTVGVPLQLPETAANAVPAEPEEPLTVSVPAEGPLMLMEDSVDEDQLVLTLRLVRSNVSDKDWTRLGVVASRQVQAKMGPDVLLSDTNYRLSKALYLLN